MDTNRCRSRLPHCNIGAIVGVPLVEIIEFQNRCQDLRLGQITVCLMAMCQSEEAVGYQHLGEDVQGGPLGRKGEKEIHCWLVLYQRKLAGLHHTVAVIKDHVSKIKPRPLKDI